MNIPQNHNILMYSHDTYGLGHIRRTMAIAEHLRGPDRNVLILTGTPLAGQLTFPKYVDFVRIPGMIKKANDEYFPLTIRIDPQQALEIRQSIIMATVQTFKPDLFIVDKEPQGLKREVMPALGWISENLKKTKTVLGMRDIMDDAETVKSDWEKKEIYATIEDLYSEVWVYGEKKIYDPVKEYDIPESIAKKLFFTGYIPRKIPKDSAAEELRLQLNVMTNENLVTVTTGGGGDGFHVLDSYLKMLEKMKAQSILPPFQTVLITGPFLSSNDKDEILGRARDLEILSYDFFSDMETLIAASDIIVSMGGYNTMCEVLSSRAMCLVIPRETPRKEQFIRAKAFNRDGLVEFIPWTRLNRDNLEEKLLIMLENKELFAHNLADFNMNGIKNIRQRISQFWNSKNECR
ncbi:glycosyltransferase family protein [Desulfospira joergensenii]|uniref:glycosyltransferase family protein n=1 Tax=Desulfospira joergensenii TaxID=53329 RepID=UPI0003B36AAA|nr:glycosyltransferase [Desulfospira joergensenii]